MSTRPSLVGKLQWAKHRVSVKEVEKLTGYKFFPGMPEEVAEVLKEKVDDDATAALMGVFYRHLWVDKLPPLEALRRAQLYLYRHPSAIPALAKRRGEQFEERDLPKETVKPGEPARHAPTGQWAAFVLSGTGR